MHALTRQMLIVVTMFCFAVPAIAQEDEEAERIFDFLEEEHALSMEFQTPHTVWAKPYAGGTIRAVFFAPWFQGSTDAREIVELMQRFDLDASAVYLENGTRLIGDGNPRWYGGEPEAGTVRATRLLGQDIDVIVLNKVMLSALPEALRDLVWKRVEEGVGLVVIGDSPAVDLPKYEPEPKAVPFALPEGNYFVAKQGRVVHLAKREPLEDKAGWSITFEHEMEKQGRALVWAAKHEPSVALEIMAPSEVSREHMVGDVLQNQPGGFDVKTIGLPEGATISARMHTKDFWHVLLQQSPANSNDTMVHFHYSPLAGGDYFIDVFAEKDGKRIAWATAPIRVVADIAIAELSLKKGWVEPGESIDGTVTLSRSLNDTESVKVRLVGERNRIFAEQSLPSTTGPNAFSFAIDSNMSPLLQIIASVYDEHGELATRSIDIRVTNRRRDEFHFVMWNVATGDLAPFGVAALAKYGVTSVLQGGPPPRAFAANDLAYVPYAASFRDSSHTLTAMLNPETGQPKSGCVHDLASMEKRVRDVVAASQAAREHGVFAYSLGDENAVRESCLGPDCLKAYRGYLAQEYGEIGKLNAEWNAQYASFDEIELLSDGDLPAADAPEWFKEYFAQRQQLHRTDSEGAKGDALEAQVTMGNTNDEMRALQAGNFARWYDRQAFQNWSYVQWCKAYQRAFKEIDPQAWTGFEGTDSFAIRKFTTRSRQGGDLDAFVRELDYFGPYEGPANEVVRSIAPAGFPRGNWIGYDPQADVLLREYWSQIADGMNTIQWWRWDNLNGYHGYLTPALAPFPAVRELLDDTQIVRDGLGTLLMHCPMEDDGIAMLYSMPSTYIAHFDQNETYGDYKRDHAVWHTLIHGAGLQFRYITDRALRLGEVDLSRYKVLILPLAYAMDEKEAQAVRSFVEQGGTVIADVRPGLYDGHCRPLAKGALDDLFGIARSENLAARPVDRLSIDGKLGERDVKMRWGNWHGKDIYPQMLVDPSVTVTTGKALGQAFQIHFWTGLNAPLCVVNDVGKGKAILLNFSVFDAPAQRFIGDVLAGSGVSPTIAITNAQGLATRHVEITRWRRDGVEVVAMLPEKDETVTVTLPGERHVYDMKNKQDLEFVKQFTVTLRANRASFFSLREQASPESSIEFSTEKVKRGETLSATYRCDAFSGTTAVRIEAIAPHDAPSDYLNKTIIVEGKSTPFTLRFALNDPTGVWTIRATNVTSNVVAERTVTVE